jgi:purine-binding chemotaxis protein CheW
MSATITAAPAARESTAASSATGAERGTAQAHAEYVTFRLADQWLGIPVMAVQEVLAAQRIAHVPMAPNAIAGFLNLRGQIVTALDLRCTLRLDPRAPDADVMNVVVRHEGELFAFMVDEVGDVVSVPNRSVESTPATLDARWRAASVGIVRREHDLLLVMSVNEVIRLEHVTG